MSWRLPAQQCRSNRSNRISQQCPAGPWRLAISNKACVLGDPYQGTHGVEQVEEEEHEYYGEQITA
jgi:hypothetical protein